MPTCVTKINMSMSLFFKYSKQLECKNRTTDKKVKKAEVHSPSYRIIALFTLT